MLLVGSKVEKLGDLHSSIQGAQSSWQGSVGTVLWACALLWLGAMLGAVLWELRCACHSVQLFLSLRHRIHLLWDKKARTIWGMIKAVCIRGPILQQAVLWI